MMQRWKKLSFRLPVFILLVSLLPLVGFNLYSSEQHRIDLLETQGRATRRIVDLAAALLEESAVDVLKHLQVSAENLNLLQLTSDDLEWGLLTLLQQNKELNELAVINTDGDEQMKVNANQVFLSGNPENRSDTVGFQTAIGGAFYVGVPDQHQHEHDVGRGYVSVVAIPLVNHDRSGVSAVLMGELSLNSILAMVTDIRIGKHGAAYVLNRQDGRIIAHQDTSLVLNKSILPVDLLLKKSDSAERSSIKFYTNASGVAVQGVFSEVEGTDWVVAGERSMERITEEIDASNRFLFILMTGLILLLLPLVYFFSRRVFRPLQLLEHGAVEVGAGRFGVDIPVMSEDEIGSVSRSFNIMADNLQQLMIERKKTDWLKTGLVQLDDCLRGISSIEELGRLASSFLAQYCNLPVAVLYSRAETDTYRLAGGFSHESSNPALQVFHSGQGVVGQVAYEQKVMELSNLPAEYLNVTSGLGSATTHSLLLIPLLHADETWGVLELGAFEPFSADVRDFLEQTSSVLAIALSLATAQKSLSTELEKSQRFSEELQAQQEELQAANEEMEEQTQRLRASEEELQAQQEELQAANEELEEKTLSLEQQKSQLKQSNIHLEESRTRMEQHARELQVVSRYKSEFLANMSHELRTPLNSLLILSQDLAYNAEQNLTSSQVESAEVIYNSGNDLLRLINEILDLAKIESGKMELNLDDTFVSDIKSRLITTFQHMAEAKGVAFNVTLAEGAPSRLHTDSQRLDQVLLNLISNAIKFTAEGSVTVDIGRPEPETVFVSSKLDLLQTCRIMVSDTGIGIPADRHDDIFGAFQQIDGSISRQYDGTGLGLTISKELTSLLGGEMRVESREGIGSTFTLFLPVSLSSAEIDESIDLLTTHPVESTTTALQEKKPGPAAPSIADDRESLKEGERVVLIVEDDLNFAKIVGDLCRTKGFRYLHAGDAETGLSLAEEFLPIAIMLDIRLPGMHGLEFLDNIKNRKDLRHIPVHVISVEDLGREALHLGAVGFLSKPASKEGLEHALTKVTEVASGRIRQLLVVEDNPTQSQSIVQLIGNGDVRSLEASTGEEALKYLCEETIDCIILDLSLPDMNGFELLRRLKNLDISLPPIIVYTGKELTREEEEQLNEYTSSIIIKGVQSPERLLDEASLFLHRVVSKLPDHKQDMIATVHGIDTQIKGRKILLVDDDMRNVFALSKVLEQQGAIVIKAANGQKALNELTKHPDIDLVLMDIMMPVMDGYEAMQKIRLQGQFARLPILALTAKAMRDDRGKCIEAGANDYLTKPVDMTKLMSLLRVWLIRS
jgi:CheY-like chemotaxis protein/signal transduction histidine kinase